MRWTIPYFSFRGASLHESILTPQSADPRFRRLTQKNFVTAGKGFASNPNQTLSRFSSLKRFIVRTWSRDQLTPKQKSKYQIPAWTMNQQKEECLWALVLVLPWCDDRKGRQASKSTPWGLSGISSFFLVSDLSFEFLFYRRMVTKRRASALRFFISKMLFWLWYLFQHFQRITLRFGWKMQRTSKILSSDSLNGLRTSNRGLNLQSFLCGRSVFFKTTTLDLLLT